MTAPLQLSHFRSYMQKHLYKKNKNNATMAKWFMKTMLIFNPSATYEDEERVGGG